MILIKPLEEKQATFLWLSSPK